MTLWWITSLDGEISFATRTARTAAEACTQLAERYGKATFAAWLEAAGYSAGEIQVAELRDERQTAGHDVDVIGPPPGLLEAAWLAFRGSR